MESKEIIHQSEEKMKKTVEVTMREFNIIRTGRANSALVEGIKVDYYGTPTPLKQLANISVPEAKLIVIQPWDSSCLADIEKAIMKSELGITPTNDGKVVRLGIPSLTKERRTDLVKLIHKLAEEGRVAIRSLRRDANEHLKQEEKNHALTEDEKFKTLDIIQKSTDKHIQQIDDLIKHKEAEIMEV